MFIPPAPPKYSIDLTIENVIHVLSAVDLTSGSPGNSSEVNIMKDDECRENANFSPASCSLSRHSPIVIGVLLNAQNSRDLPDFRSRDRSAESVKFRLSRYVS